MTMPRCSLKPAMTSGGIPIASVAMETCLGVAESKADWMSPSKTKDVISVHHSCVLCKMVVKDKEMCAVQHLGMYAKLQILLHTPDFVVVRLATHITHAIHNLPTISRSATPLRSETFCGLLT